MLEGILIEGFIYGIMALGVFITFRILDFPDMTVDGSFPMGAAITATMIVSGEHYVLALVVSFIGGLLAGVVTALIHIKLRVHNLLAGILTLTMLYSVNMRIMHNKSNMPILRKDTLITWASDLIPSNPDLSLVLLFALILFIIKILLDLFFITDMGLAMTSMGDNPKMIVTLGINDNIMKIIGVSLANGLVGVSGGLAAMYLGFGDVNLGQGVIISGLASVMLGEFVLRYNNIFAKTLRVIIGCLIYKGVMYVGRAYGYHLDLTPNDLKLITGLLIIVCLAITRFSVKSKDVQVR